MTDRAGYYRVAAEVGSFDINLAFYTAEGVGDGSSGNITLAAVIVPVPEPSSIALIGMVALGLAKRQRWHRAGWPPKPM